MTTATPEPTGSDERLEQGFYNDPAAFEELFNSQHLIVRAFLIDRTNEELMKAYQRGIGKAFDEIYRRLHPRMLYFVSQRCPEFADDILNEVWKRVVERRAQYNPMRGSVSGWVFGIARHESGSHFRLERKRPEPLDGIDPPDPRSLPPEDLATIERCVSKLSPLHRQVLQLTIYEGMTAQEAAQALAVPAGRVARLRQQALDFLRQCGNP
jgi:RNA polymerase sigma-70 factor (ECF subfamily)